jgi:thiamine pyrophosphate-dependent acetolactate synthase large subunit-like protein
MLVSAQRPVVMVDFLEQEKDIAALTELAEMLSLPIIDLQSAVSFPNTHPLNLSELADEALSQADLGLSLNVPYLFHALSKVDRATRRASYCIPTTARIVDVSLRHLAWRSSSQSYGRLQATDLSITDNAGHALAGLVERCRQLLVDQPGQQVRLQESNRRIQATQNAARQQWQQQAERTWKDMPVSLPRLASELWEVVKDEDWVLTNSTLSDWVWRIWQFTSAGQFVRREGLGCGIGHSLGVALAHRPQRRLCIRHPARWRYALCRLCPMDCCPLPHPSAYSYVQQPLVL